MGVKRRDFLKIAGLTAAAVSATPAALMLLDGVPEARAEESAKVLSSSRAGQWAMVVDMRKLTEEDVEKAVAACHSAHNVPDIRKANDEKDVQHEIKWIWPVEFENAFPEQAGPYMKDEFAAKEFLVLCNHCTDPPCVRVCPTQATFKRPKDGIVMMDMHRCIGCRFCMAGCPFGARSFNFMDPRPFIKNVNQDYPTRERGVVEKCNFCAERLAKGQYPACVEAVESGALAFGDITLPSSEVGKLVRENPTIRRKSNLGTGPNVFYIV